MGHERSSIRIGMAIPVPAVGPAYRYKGSSTVLGRVIFVSRRGNYAVAEIKTKAGSYKTSVPLDPTTGKIRGGVVSRTIQAHITRPKAYLYGDVLPHRKK